MAEKKPKQKKPGRPWKNTPGSRPRTLRATDAEFAVLVETLRKLRAGAAQKA